MTSDRAPAGWECIYQLATDAEKIADVQTATTDTADFGVEPMPAIFGSAADAYRRRELGGGGQGRGNQECPQ